MTQIALSDDLIEIGGEIKMLKKVAEESVLEIGKRLKHVRDNDLAHGQWESWLLSVDIVPQTARKMIQAFEQFGNRAMSSVLPTGKIFEMLSLPESVDRQEFITQPHELPSGEQKIVDEMTVKELREVKKALQEAERRAAQLEETATAAENSSRHFEKLFNSIKNQPPRYETRTVEKLPDDYNILKEQSEVAQKLNVENVMLKRDLMSQKQEYEQRLTKEDSRVAINRELRKSCKELLQNHAMYSESILYNLSMSAGERDAAQILEAFQLQYSSELQSFFNKLKQMTAVKTVS